MPFLPSGPGCKETLEKSPLKSTQHLHCRRGLLLVIVLQLRPGERKLSGFHTVIFPESSPKIKEKSGKSRDFWNF